MFSCRLSAALHTREGIMSDLNPYPADPYHQGVAGTPYPTDFDGVSQSSSALSSIVQETPVSRTNRQAKTMVRIVLLIDKGINGFS